MKFIFFYLNFLLFLSFGKYSHLAHKKLHHKHRQTPKADDLKNHFGYHPLESPYGPQHQKIVYVKREEPNYLISPCDISLQPNYDACSSFSSCNLCVVSPYCGM